MIIETDLLIRSMGQISESDMVIPVSVSMLSTLWIDCDVFLDYTKMHCCGLRWAVILIFNFIVN